MTIVTIAIILKVKLSHNDARRKKRMRKILKSAAALAIAVAVTVACIPVQANAATKSITPNNWTGYFGANDNSFWEGSTGAFTAKSASSWTASMDTIGWGGVWGAQVKNENLKYQKGKTYVIKFTLKSTNVNKLAILKLEGDDAGYETDPSHAPLLYKWMYLEEGKEKTYTYEYTVPKNYTGHLSVIFGLGGEMRDRDEEMDLYPAFDKTGFPIDSDNAVGTDIVCKNFSMTLKDVTPKNTTVKKVTSPSKGKAKVSIKKVSGVKGYYVQYSTSKKFKGAKKVKTTKTTATIKKLKSGSRYYFRVKAYNASGKTSKSWSKAKNVVVK